MSDGTDVLRAIDQLRHDLSGYHGQLKAHNDLKRHCDNQRERIVELEGLYAKAKADRDEAAMDFSKEHDRSEFLMRENAKLSELVRDMYACISHANEQDWFYFERDKLGCGMSCTVNGEACGLCALADRMRELGVEVDNGLR